MEEKKTEPSGYIYKGRFFSSLDDLKGNTFSDGFIPVPVYFAPRPEGFWEKAYSLLTRLWELHNEGKEGTEEYEKAQIYWESHVCYHEPLKMSWNTIKEKYMEFHKMDEFTESMAIDVDFGYWLMNESHPEPETWPDQSEVMEKILNLLNQPIQFSKDQRPKTTCEYLLEFNEWLKQRMKF